MYREQAAIAATSGRTAGGWRRVDVMIAAVAVADDAALATCNFADFAGLEVVLEVIEL